MKVVFILVCALIGVHCGLLNDLVDNKPKEDNKKVLGKVVNALDEGTIKLVETVSTALHLNKDKEPKKPENKVEDAKTDKVEDNLKEATNTTAETTKPTDVPTEDKTELDKDVKTDVNEKKDDVNEDKSDKAESTTTEASAKVPKEETEAKPPK